MSDYGKRLAVHPGVLPAAGMTLMGAMIGARNSVKAGFYGAALMGLLCWTPVLITARTQPLPDDEGDGHG